MKVCRIVFALAVFVLLASSVSLAQGNKVVLKREWAPGVYVMTETSKSQGEQTVGDQAEKTASEETMVWELRVGEPNAQGEKKIVAKVVKCKFTEAGDSPSSYDSEAPANQQDKDSAFVYGPLIGAPIEIALDPDDMVIEVSGLDKLWRDLSAKATTDEQKGRLAEASIELGDKTIEQSLRRIESIVPKKAVANGDKWTAGIRSDLPLIGEVKQRFDCTFQGVEDAPSGKLAVVHLEAKYEATKPKPGQIQGQEVTVSKLDVTETGNVKFNLETGIAAVDEKTLDVSAVLDATDEKGQPLRVLVKGHNEISTTIVPAGQAAPKGAEKAGAAAGGADAPKATGSSGSGINKMLKGLPPKTSPPDSAPPEKKPSPSASAAPATYVTYRYIDQGGIRDRATGEWLEAFRLLMPKGWRFQGGLRWVASEKPPNQLSKTDAIYPVRSDYAVASPDGRCAMRSYPAVHWVDTSRTAGTRMGAGFRNGANYNGMIVWPVVTPEQYIAQFVYPRQHGEAANLKVIKQEPLPKLAELYSVESARFGQAMGRGGAQAKLEFKAGSITVDYTDGQTPYRETFVAVMQYMDTAGMIMFHPRVNFSFRAPRDEFDKWKPVFATMVTSIQNNPRWMVYFNQLIEKSTISQQQMDDYCHKIQREIAQSHAATTHELARDMGYLSSPYHPYKGTDGNRYTLPTDKYHFMNAKGELLSQDSWDPPSSEWKSIEPYNQ